ncbi:MAG: Flp pilus assembly complex ATPase component TadA [Nitrospirae bacterium]|nr:Flp pilus assembly complex ATPase component TadA [Nitrospirota bacterium]
MRNKQKIGELLIDLNIISREDLDRAIQEQKRTGQRLGAVLLKLNLLSEEDLEYLLSRQLNVPAINLEHFAITGELLNIIPEKIIRKHLVLPVQLEGKTLTVAMANPKDLILLDDLAYVTGYKIAPVVTGISALQNKISEIFEKPSAGWEKTLETDSTADLEIIKVEKDVKEEDLEKVFQSAEEAPVIKLVNAVILASLEQGATHVHVEPREDGFEIYLRIDGKLKLLVKPPPVLRQNFINRMKILSSIDILKRFVPGEGYFRAKSKNMYFDIDVATIPSLHGERMVMTFQQPFSKERLRLDNLGFAPDTLERFKALIGQQRGFLLVTGPPDSGKSSTLYAALNHIKSPDKAIFTYERTVKNRLAGINQGQPNEKAGYTYEMGLQSLIKQDMDVLMVGELMTRDAIMSTLNASLSNSKTLVMGRILSNDTIASILLMVDMDVPPFMLYSALTAMLGQRLVRRLCQKCIEDFDPPVEIAAEIRKLTGTARPRLFRSRGCPACGLTGYKDRIGLFELIEPNDELRDAILTRAEPAVLKRVAESIEYRSFREDGLIKAAEGLTSYDEVLRLI